MATATYQATINTDRSVTVAFGTSAALGSGATATLLFDNTKNMDDVRAALRALERSFSREASKTDSPADMATSGSSTE